METNQTVRVPSLTKTNHRYRGEPERDKHNLLVLQALHDIRDLCYTIDRNDHNPSDIIKGQTDFIKENMQRLVAWERIDHTETDTIMANAPTATRLMGNIQLSLIPTEGLPPVDNLKEIIGLENRVGQLHAYASMLNDLLIREG